MMYHVSQVYRRLNIGSDSTVLRQIYSISILLGNAERHTCFPIELPAQDIPPQASMNF